MCLNAIVRLVDLDCVVLVEDPTILQLRGVVFNESRCGSTLTANAKMALNPDKHRVYSDSAPTRQAMMACGETSSECSVGAAANLLKDVIYILVRLDEPEEENVFFKSNLQNTYNTIISRSFSNNSCIFLYKVQYKS
mmetsp:Transcript_15825/g.34187  ORF Transcript_15825/g.34187 Transcript_15825/m.34187 type:complete len:137 (+) Transcript_15825:143-553(+)